MKFLQEVVKLKKVIPHKSNPEIEAALKLGVMLENLGIEPEMRQMGSFGTVVFEVSTLKVLTVKDVRRRARARYATHEVYGGKTRIEYVGMDADEITFEIQLNGQMGVKVEQEMTKLLEMCRSGESYYLILGDHAYGQNKWVLEGVDLKHEYADKEGNVEVITASVTLKEELG